MVAATNNGDVVLKTKFDAWWLIWPPGTKKGKDAARKAYAARVKCIAIEYPDEDAHQLLEDGLREYLMSKNWCDGFRLLPVTWLRQGRWQDDIDRADKFQGSFEKSKRVSNMDDTTREEMARAAAVKAQRSRPRINVNLTRAFDRGFRLPDGYWFPQADPLQAEVLREQRLIHNLNHA